MGLCTPELEIVVNDEAEEIWKEYLFKMLSCHDSPDFIRVMKSRKMRWAGHVARMGAIRNT
jgi:hypothetical protein